jgi:hypothetical protein
MSRDNQVYADAIMLAYCGVDPSERIERERKAFAATLKSRTALLASHRGPRRSRKRAQTPKAEPESFGAKLTAAVKSRLARRH